MKRQNRLLLLLLASALLLTACGLGPRSEPYTLSVWYVDGDPLAEPLAALAESCRGSRELGTLALLLRPFADQEALTRTLESGLVPDLLLGSHELAFSLYDRGLLVDVGGVSPRYPAWLSHRSDCIGHGFYPIGFSLPLLASRDRQSPESLWADAAAYGRWNALPFLCVQSFAPLFYQSLLDQGQEFSADPVKDSLNRNYVNFYNAVAETAFLRGLSTDLELDLPCRICRPSYAGSAKGNAWAASRWTAASSRRWTIPSARRRPCRRCCFRSGAGRFICRTGTAPMYGTGAPSSRRSGTVWNFCIEFPSGLCYNSHHITKTRDSSIVFVIPVRIDPILTCYEVSYGRI